MVSVVLRFHIWFIMRVYYKMPQMLLQNATAILLQNETEVYYKMRQCTKFRKIHGKHLCGSLFLIQNIAKYLRTPILNNTCKRLLLKMCSWNWEKLKIRDKWNCISLCFSFMIGSLWSLYSRTIFLWRGRNKLQTINI